MKKVLVILLMVMFSVVLVGCNESDEIDNTDESDEIDNTDESDNSNFSAVSLEGVFQTNDLSWTQVQKLSCGDNIIKEVNVKTVVGSGNMFSELSFYGFAENDYTFLRTMAGGIFYKDDLGDDIRFDASEVGFDVYQFISTLQNEFATIEHDEENELFTFNSRLNEHLISFYDIKNIDIQVNGYVYYSYFEHEGEQIPYPTLFEMNLSNVEFNSIFTQEDILYDECTLTIDYSNVGETTISEFPLEYRDENYVNLGPTLVSEMYYEQVIQNEITNEIIYSDNYFYDEIGDVDYIIINVVEEIMYGIEYNDLVDIIITDVNEHIIFTFITDQMSPITDTFILTEGAYIVELHPKNIEIGDTLNVSLVNLTEESSWCYFVLGSTDIEITLGTEYVDPGYITLSSCEDIQVDTNLDINTVGSYYYTYYWTVYGEQFSRGRNLIVID